MFRKALFASLIAFGAAGVAQAQDFGPQLIGGGPDAQVVYAVPNRNVVGGAVASISGGGDDVQIAYGPNTAAPAPSGLVAELVGGGENTQLVYHQATPSSDTMLAGQTARHGG